MLDWVKHTQQPVVVLDKLTYAGNLTNLDSLKNNPLLTFVKGDINDRPLLDSLLTQFKPYALLNFAAESHVDRSIHAPTDFIQTNIQGTFHLLEAARAYWSQLAVSQKDKFRFLQVSTDEVYGSLQTHESAFTETHRYSPNNPYSATKAAADHLVQSYGHTYQLPTLITNCSNNYGPYQFPEKLMPFTLLNALQNKPLPVYGDGLQIRDWLYVTDHCTAIRKVLAEAIPGETYNIGGNCEKTNLEVVTTICQILDDIKPADKPYASLITHIADRPGHDRRYAIDASKIATELNWYPTENFASGLQKTIMWYLNHFSWINTVTTNTDFQAWLKTHYVSQEQA